MTKKAIALLEQLEKNHARQAALLAELAAVLSEDETPGQVAKRLLDGFVKLWANHYGGEKYVVRGAVDMALLKRLLKSLPADEIDRRMVAFFASRDRFLVDGKHTLPLFVGAVNKLGASARDMFDEPPAVGCRHRPPCASDEAHTRRTLDEIRRPGGAR